MSALFNLKSDGISISWSLIPHSLAQWISLLSWTISVSHRRNIYVFWGFVDDVFEVQQFAYGFSNVWFFCVFFFKCFHQMTQRISAFLLQLQYMVYHRIAQMLCHYLLEHPYIWYFHYGAVFHYFLPSSSEFIPVTVEKGVFKFVAGVTALFDDCFLAFSEFSILVCVCPWFLICKRVRNISVRIDCGLGFSLLVVAGRTIRAIVPESAQSRCSSFPCSSSIVVYLWEPLRAVAADVPDAVLLTMDLCHYCMGFCILLLGRGVGRIFDVVFSCRVPEWFCVGQSGVIVLVSDGK